MPVVALETAVVTHGLPHPINYSLAIEMEDIVREYGAVPATIGLLDGCVQIGFSKDELERLATIKNARKISRRDFGAAVAQKASGGTTVAGTLVAAQIVGIKVFATGGIGGIHRGSPFDISTDLPELSRTPVIVVCAGAKSILDLPATLEYLETSGVPVVGYQTDEFPAFYARTSGLKVPTRVETPHEAADLAKQHWDLGLHSSVLIVQPPPEESALSNEVMENAVRKALEEAEQKHITGQAVTPYLLQRVNELTDGSSMQANLGLLQNNARLAAKLAKEFARKGDFMI